MVIFLTNLDMLAGVLTMRGEVTTGGREQAVSSITNITLRDCNPNYSLLDNILQHEPSDLE